MRKFLLGMIMVGLMSVVVACNTDEQPDTNKENDVTAVATAKVVQGDLLVDRTIYGNISPINQQPVMVEQPGEIKELLVENGDMIEEDDHIATIKTPMGDQKVKAPMDGVVAQLEVKEGALVSNENPLALMVDLDEVHANFSITKTMRDLFAKNQLVLIQVEDKKYDGKVLAMDVLPNEQGQFSLIAKVKNHGDILPGAVAKLMLTEKRVEDTLLVPSETIVMENEDAFVYIVDGDVAKKVAVEIEETQSDFTAVSGKLSEADEVITNGQFTLVDGNKVKVVKEGNES